MVCKVRQSGFSAMDTGECLTEFVTGEHIDLDCRLASFTYDRAFEVASVQLMETNVNMTVVTYTWFVLYRRRR